MYPTIFVAGYRARSRRRDNGSWFGGFDSWFRARTTRCCPVVRVYDSPILTRVLPNVDALSPLLDPYISTGNANMVASIVNTIAAHCFKMSVLVGLICCPSAMHQKCQTEPQLEHFASVAFSFRESPTARSDHPPVKIASVAFPPLIPFFSVTMAVVTHPTE